MAALDLMVINNRDFLPRFLSLVIDSLGGEAIKILEFNPLIPRKLARIRLTFIKVLTSSLSQHLAPGKSPLLFTSSTPGI
ncbi:MULTISPECIES: hypothetical protein [unclassified Anabaena]|uniref:hypothetical protein n=1 Tax=unclassified Anabaena TaxID=2619674 RepID=UPI001446036A|nr:MULTISPECIES: hypothetical protein [unclassified Anabaena]MTJ07129.1 hypothetical protein [Anabaena sp. UHCC 0204]MTJ51954.1 hypothetical protein [Anabaena sp. UHCC 0253]